MSKDLIRCFGTSLQDFYPILSVQCMRFAVVVVLAFLFFFCEYTYRLFFTKLILA